ncbi:MAG: AMP-binding protein, partial [Halieaceae bacterium]
MSLVISGCACLLTLSTLAWWRYRWVQDHPVSPPDTDPYRLRNSNSPTPWERTPHQRGVQYLHEVFERSARQYPNYPALSVPETGEQLSYRELDHRANQIAQALGTHITGPNQIVGVCIKQNCADVVAAHLGILKAGAAQVFLDPDAP